MIVTEREHYPRRYSIVLDNSKYLIRWILFRMTAFRVFLHEILRPDPDRGPHNHPWPFAFSFVIRGGYVEDITYIRRDEDGAIVERREWTEIHTAPALSWKAFRPGCYHRITTVQPNTWSLFFAGRRLRSWGFLIGWRHEDAPDQDKIED